MTATYGITCRHDWPRPILIGVSKCKICLRVATANDKAVAVAEVRKR